MWTSNAVIVCGDDWSKNGFVLFLRLNVDGSVVLTEGVTVAMNCLGLSRLEFSSNPSAQLVSNGLFDEADLGRSVNKGGDWVSSTGGGGAFTSGILSTADGGIVGKRGSLLPLHKGWVGIHLSIRKQVIWNELLCNRLTERRKWCNWRFELSRAGRRKCPGICITGTSVVCFRREHGQTLG